MKSKKRFALLLCALLVLMSAVSSSVFADAGGNGNPHDKIKVHTKFDFGDGFTLYSQDESQTLGHFTPWGGGYEKNGPEEKLGGLKILVTDAGEKYEVFLSTNGNGNNEDEGKATDNYWIHDAKLITPPVDPPVENGSLVIHKTSNKEGTYTFSVNGEPVAIPVIDTDADAQSTAIELPAGTYTVSENDAATGGYTLVTKAGLEANPTAEATNVNVDIVAGESTHVYFDNQYTEIPGPKFDVTFTKALAVAEDSIVPDIAAGLELQFVLSDGTNTYNQKVTFSSILQQEVTFKDVLPGIYTLTEVNLPAGWTSSLGDGVSVTVDETGTITFDGAESLTVTNTYDVQEQPVLGQLSFLKRLVVQGGSQQPILMDGGMRCHFALTENDGRIIQADVWVTFEKDGYVTFTDIPVGTYTLTEVNLPPGWTSSLGSGVTVTVEEIDGEAIITSPIGDVVTNTYYVPSEIIPPEIIPPVTPPPEIIDPPVEENPQPLPDDEHLEDPEQGGGDVVKPTLPGDEHLEIEPTQKQASEKTDTANPDQPKTGDEQNVAGWGSIMLLALAAMGITISARRKNEDREN